MKTQNLTTALPELQLLTDSRWESLSVSEAPDAPGPLTSETADWAPISGMSRVPERKGRSVRRWITLLAFGQSLAFLAFWLFFCAVAGAVQQVGDSAARELIPSAYRPTKVRDPFLPPGAVTRRAETTIVPAGPVELRLQGILYQPDNPSAIVNDQLVTLNEPVAITTSRGEVKVRAVQITRDKVVLDVGGQVTELTMNANEGLPTPTK